MKDVVEFFDSHATRWDSYHKKEDEPIIREILSRAGVSSNDVILDVGCGTGILVPFFLELGVIRDHLTGIDISGEMVAVFSHKFPSVRVVQADFEEAEFSPESFTKVIIFNSFPHFRNPQNVFRKSHELLKGGGKLIIAHSMNRDTLNRHHKDSKGPVEDHCLIADEALEAYFEACRFQDVLIKDARYFHAEGRKQDSRL